MGFSSTDQLKPAQRTAHLTEGPNGAPVLIADTTSPGTVIHTHDGENVLDRVWLYANNTDSVTRTLTIELAGTGGAANNIVVDVLPRDGLALALPGVPISGGAAIRAYCPTADVVSVVGYVEDLTRS